MGKSNYATVSACACIKLSVLLLAVKLVLRTTWVSDIFTAVPTVSLPYNTVITAQNCCVGHFFVSDNSGSVISDCMLPYMDSYLLYIGPLCEQSLVQLEHHLKLRRYQTI